MAHTEINKLVYVHAPPKFLNSAVFLKSQRCAFCRYLEPTISFAQTQCLEFELKNTSSGCVYFGSTLYVRLDSVMEGHGKFSA